jgi:hypothetical protein
MTLSILAELSAYWRKYPPTHILLKSFFGHEGNEKATAEETITELSKSGFTINKQKRKKNG